MRKPANNHRMGFVPPKQRIMPGHSARQKTILIVLVIVVCGCALSIFTTRKTQAVTNWTVSPAGDTTNFWSLLNVERIFPSAGSNASLPSPPIANLITVTREDDPDNGIGNCLIVNASCSLRQASHYACYTSGDYVIDFASNVHNVGFALTVPNPIDPSDPNKSLVIRLNGLLSIQGPGSGQLTITRAAD